jgi:TatD DNase family protein
MSSVFSARSLVDSHCHLDIEAFDVDRSAVLDRAVAAGVGLIVVPGIDLEQCRKALIWAEQTAQVYVAVGIHPNSADPLPPGWLEELRRLAQHPRVVAIGEIGLDNHWDKVAPARQQLVFVAQLALAAELGLPVIIHSREANADVAGVLREWVNSPEFHASPLAARSFAGVLHAFSGDLALAEEAYTWNFVLGLGGPVTFKNAHQLHALVPQLRLDRLMLETDAPYLTPHPFRGQRNEPAYTALVCEQMARLCMLAAAGVAAATTAVALRFYQLEDPFGADVAKRSKLATA